jgi:hypothetical protein
VQICNHDARLHAGCQALSASTSSRHIWTWTKPSSSAGCDLT